MNRPSSQQPSCFSTLHTILCLAATTSLFNGHFALRTLLPQLYRATLIEISATKCWGKTTTKHLVSIIIVCKLLINTRCLSFRSKLRVTQLNNHQKKYILIASNFRALDLKQSHREEKKELLRKAFRATDHGLQLGAPELKWQRFHNIHLHIFTTCSARMKRTVKSRLYQRWKGQKHQVTPLGLA